MPSSKKMFRIGEYAIGGKIQVQIVGKLVSIKALDWETENEVLTGTCLSNDPNSQSKIDTFLNELTSYYYAEQIMTWIKSKTKLN